MLEVAHAASSSRSAANRLVAPRVRANLGRRVAATRAPTLLQVIRVLSTPTAQNVRLVVLASEAGGSFRL